MALIFSLNGNQVYFPGFGNPSFNLRKVSFYLCKTKSMGPYRSNPSLAFPSTKSPLVHPRFSLSQPCWFKRMSLITWPNISPRLHKADEASPRGPTMSIFLNRRHTTKTGSGQGRATRSLQVGTHRPGEAEGIERSVIELVEAGKPGSNWQFQGFLGALVPILNILVGE